MRFHAYSIIIPALIAFAGACSDEPRVGMKFVVERNAPGEEVMIVLDGCQLLSTGGGSTFGMNPTDAGGALRVESMPIGDGLTTRVFDGTTLLVTKTYDKAFLDSRARDQFDVVARSGSYRLTFWGTDGCGD